MISTGMFCSCSLIFNRWRCWSIGIWDIAWKMNCKCPTYLVKEFIKPSYFLPWAIFVNKKVLETREKTMTSMVISTFKTYVVCNNSGLRFFDFRFFLLTRLLREIIVQADGLSIEFAFWTGTFCPFSFIYFIFEEYLENEVLILVGLL